MTDQPLSKIDVAAIRKCDWLTVRYYAQPSASRTSQIEAWKRAEKTERDPFAQDVVHIVPASVTIRHDYSRISSSAECVAVIWPYSEGHVRSIIDTLRAGDQIELQFYPDGHSSPALLKAGFHADLLSLSVRRNDKRVASFDLTVELSNNTWRMCRHVTERQLEQIAAE